MDSKFEYDVFLSHSSKDKDAVRELGERLEKSGLEPWFDEKQIRVGAPLADAIGKALEKSRCLLFIISKNSVKSDWAALEWNTAVSRDPMNREGRFIPLLLDDVEIPDMLSHFLHVDWRTRKDEEYVKLLQAIREPAVVSQPSTDEIDPDWRNKIDRIEQTGASRYLVQDMLRAGRPKCVCFCWYGEEGHGVATFHDRLKDEFADVSQGRSWSVDPEWANVVERQSFFEMMEHTLEADPAEIGAAIRRHFGGQHGSRELLYVNHAPITSPKQLNPLQLLEYLKWWDEVLDYLEPQQHVALGISFVVTNPVQFRHAIDTEVGITSHAFSDRLVFEVLPVLEKLTPQHMWTFFKRIKLHLRVRRETLELAIEQIFADTKGEYDAVVRELEILLNGGFEKLKAAPASKHVTSGDDV
jgi:hypothetical protein